MSGTEMLIGLAAAAAAFTPLATALNFWELWWPLGGLTG
jgi:hypothetical protein